jgi:CrcB protein
MRALLIAVAGAAGALARYSIGLAVGVRQFPWTTLGINLLGSFLLGVLLHRPPGRLSDDVRIALGTGFLGAFTTFSTFSNETVAMLRDGRASLALVYVSASIVGGLLAAAAGYRLAV